MDLKGTLGNKLDSLKSKISNNDADEEVEVDEEEEESDILIRLNIPSNINIPDTLMSPSKLKKVRFDISPSNGFSQRQVTEFHSKITETVNYLHKALDLRNVDVHKLASAVDKATVDNLNLRSELEIYRNLGGKPVVNEDGEYVTESQLVGSDKEVYELRQENSKLREDAELKTAEINSLRQKLNEAISQAHSTPSVSAAPVVPSVASGAVGGLTDAEREELNNRRNAEQALDEWEQAVNDEYNRMESERDTLLQEVEALKTQLQSGHVDASQITDLTARLSEAQNQVTQLNQQLQASNSQLAEAQNSLNESQNALSQWEEHVNGLTSENENLKNTVNSLQASTRNAEEQLSSLQQRLQEANVAASNAQEKAADAEGQIGNYTQHIQQLKGQVQSLSQQAQKGQQLESELISLRQQLQNAQQLDAQVQTLTQQLNAAYSQNQTLQQSADALQSELQAAKSAPQSDPGKVATLEEHIVQLNSHIAQLEDYAQKLLDGIEERDAYIQSVQRQLDSVPGFNNLEFTGESVEGYGQLPPGVSAEDL